MMRVIWGDMALRMLDSVGEYIAKDNARAATKLLQQIRKSVQLLRSNPYLGRRSEYEDIRELVVHPNYLVSYRVSADTIQILQVWHVAQQRYH